MTAHVTMPTDAVAAVTHADPYPYYADLVARRPLDRDERLGLWVASSAEVVTAVLTDARCRVRPAAEPVPRALVDAPAGEIFRRLVRQNDGAHHAALKPAITATLDALSPARVNAASRACARTLVTMLRPQTSGAALDEFIVALAPTVVAALLGVAEDARPDVVEWTRAFVGGIAPGATPAAVAGGHAAASRLLDLGRGLVSPDGLVGALASHAGATDAVIANALGFLSQSYDATAGLIGNALVALARHPVLADAARLPDVVREVVRHDAPVQNTRRFVAEDATIGGHAMKEGDVILVVLAAANRDAAANPDPARFDVERRAPRTFTFGVGPHACPGALLASTIAIAGVAALLEAGVTLERLADGVAYRPSANARVPRFGDA